MGSISNFANSAFDGVFNSDVGKVDPVLGLSYGYGSGIKDFAGDLTGENAADAANDAAKLQYQGTLAGIKAQQEALAQQRQDLAPFRGLASQDVLNRYKYMGMAIPNYAYDPNNDALLNNALNRTTRAVMDAQAAKGKLGSGSTLNALNESMAPIYMRREQQDFQKRYNINNQYFNQLSQLVGNSQNAAAGQGAATQNSTNNITDLTTQGTNALAAGQIGAANAQQQGAQNMMGLAALAASFFSDERLKENIQYIGKDADGLNLYSFNYKNSDGQYIGKMAQEIAKVDPSHVITDQSGYLKVTYKYAPKRVA